jgi:hypothetical protein
MLRRSRRRSSWTRTRSRFAARTGDVELFEIIRKALASPT